MKIVLKSLIKDGSYFINSMKDISNIPFNSTLFTSSNEEQEIHKVFLVDNKILVLLRKEIENKILYADYVDTLRKYAKEHNLTFNLLQGYTIFNLSELYSYEDFMSDNFISSGTEISTIYTTSIFYLGEYSKYINSSIESTQQEIQKLDNRILLFTELNEL